MSLPSPPVILEIFGDESIPVGGRGDDQITLSSTFEYAIIYGGVGQDAFVNANSRTKLVDVERSIPEGPIA